jgi:hypothetical protein
MVRLSRPIACFHENQRFASGAQPRSVGHIEQQRLEQRTLIQTASPEWRDVPIDEHETVFITVGSSRAAQRIVVGKTSGASGFRVIVTQPV